MLLLSAPQPLKLLSKPLPSAQVICRLQCTWTPYNKIEDDKQYKEKKCVLLLRKKFQFQNIATFALMFYYLFSRANLLHGNSLLTGFNISIKIFLTKITFGFEYTISQFQLHISKTLMVGKLQHGILNCWENQAFFNYFQSKVFSLILVHVHFTFQKYITIIECLCKYLNHCLLLKR